MYKDNETLRHVCQLLSFLILFTCARTVPINILYREKKFKYIAFSTLSVQILVGVIAIIAALCGLGVYALVLSQVLSAFFLFIIYWLKFKIKFKFKFSTSSFRKIYSYSVYSFVSSVIYYFSRNLDKILIAKYIGTDALGYYEKSYRLMFMPIDNITFVITPVLHPFFAELQNDLKGIARKYMKIVELLSFISFPLSIFLFFSSSELIMLFFGCQWTSSIPVFKIMALSVSTQMLTTTMGAMYNAVNATKKGFVAACISTILLVSSFILSIISFGTIESVATGFLISQTIFCFYNYYLFLSVLKYPYIDFIKVLIKPTIVAFVLLVLFYFESEIIGEINYLLSLVIKGVIFFLVLILAMELLSDYKPVTYVINKISIK